MPVTSKTNNNNKTMQKKLKVFSDLKKNIQFRIWGLGAFKGTAQGCYKFEPSVEPSSTEHNKEKATV